MEEELLLTPDKIMSIEEDVEDAVFSGQATDSKGVAIAKAQLAKATKHYEGKLQQMALNYDIICKETDAISYTKGVLEGRKQEREGRVKFIDWTSLEK